MCYEFSFMSSNYSKTFPRSVQVHLIVLQALTRTLYCIIYTHSPDFDMNDSVTYSNASFLTDCTVKDVREFFQQGSVKNDSIAEVIKCHNN